MKPVWLRLTAGETVPKNVVKLDEHLVVGRAWHRAEYLPATVNLEKSQAHVCKNGREFIKTKYEILLDNNYSWQSCEFKYFPLYAQDFNTKTNGNNIFIGRVKYNDTMRVGKIEPTEGLIRIPYEGKEITLNTYDMLICDKSANWISARLFYTPSDAVVAGYDYFDYHESVNYVGRSLHEGKWVLTNVLPSLSMAFVLHEGEKLYVRDYQLLCGRNYRWQKIYNNFIPPNAVSIGTTAIGEPLYVGRKETIRGLLVGTISLNRKSISVPDYHYGRDFEILLVE